MPVPVACKCGQKFSAKDELAGRTVKCPKCGNSLQIPRPGAPDQGGPGSVASGGSNVMGTGAPSGQGGAMSQLFDESGMGAPAGQGEKLCPSCVAPMAPTAIICVQCGFNLQMGRHLETDAGVDVSSGGAPNPESDTEKIMARAHGELDDSPLSKHDATFGDEGISTYLMTFIMLVGMGLLIAGGTGLMLVMDVATEWLSLPIMLIFGGFFLWGLGWIWLTVLSFFQDVASGFISLFVLPIPLIGLVFSFMRSGMSMYPFAMIFVSHVMIVGAWAVMAFGD